MLHIQKNIEEECYELQAKVGRIQVSLGQYSLKSLEGFIGWLLNGHTLYNASNIVQVSGIVIGVMLDEEEDRKVVLSLCDQTFVVELGPMDPVVIKAMGEGLRRELKR